MLESSTLAPLYALMSAVSFGASTNLIKQGMAYVKPQTAAMISIASTLSCYLIVSPFWMRLEYLLSSGVLLFAFVGLIHPIFSRYLAYEANLRVGPTISTAFDATVPLMAAIMAIIALGESLTLGIALGTLIITAGVMLVSWDSRGMGVTLRAALFFALGAAFIRALIIVIGRFGMLILPSPITGAFVSFMVSFLGSVIVYRSQKGKLSTGIPRGGLIWCSLAGLTSAFGVASMYASLLFGQVLIVTPIFYSYPIFTMALAMLFRTESPTRRAITGVFLVVGGVILVTRVSVG